MEPPAEMAPMRAGVVQATGAAAAVSGVAMMPDAARLAAAHRQTEIRPALAKLLLKTRTAPAKLLRQTRRSAGVTCFTRSELLEVFKPVLRKM
jgi:hypothetical protein